MHGPYLVLTCVPVPGTWRLGGRPASVRETAGSDSYSAGRRMSSVPPAALSISSSWLGRGHGACSTLQGLAFK
ncbi:hypothetical protein BD311DRAFT_402182 [Dichomitus squalens]|uniref:Uncharacterized protein n=1 Tax=Dichomitus squalens TaxID=114155 RepID=A0A4Q9MIF0_9APHY|nr:hypothetical protein BD311DRAFT_402182 [Dichomitus squalens]